MTFSGTVKTLFGLRGEPSTPLIVCHLYSLVIPFPIWNNIKPESPVPSSDYCLQLQEWKKKSFEGLGRQELVVGQQEAVAIEIYKIQILEYTLSFTSLFMQNLNKNT